MAKLPKQMLNGLKDKALDFLGFGGGSGGGGGGSTWLRPVDAPFGTPFGQRGSMWSSGRHTGLDFPAAIGTAIRSVAAWTSLHGAGRWTLRPARHGQPRKRPVVAVRPHVRDADEGRRRGPGGTDDRTCWRHWQRHWSPPPPGGSEERRLRRPDGLPDWVRRWRRNGRRALAERRSPGAPDDGQPVAVRRPHASTDEPGVWRQPQRRQRLGHQREERHAVSGPHAGHPPDVRSVEIAATCVVSVRSSTASARTPWRTCTAQCATR